ncbi:hypothetical protein M514_05926 [Trichuris suis]|uniref:Uncharacterized protein n=1 Tax=Trichuris suis TaxID=68888 RepID=A0A085M7M0_9BILA|nr:hypothetical protein M513_05926 [Trichuris suis]KFD65572.1 hypothetical protein M514_05926 [Trichuris suis]
MLQRHYGILPGRVSNDALKVVKPLIDQAYGAPRKLGSRLLAAPRFEECRFLSGKHAANSLWPYWPACRSPRFALT